MTRLFAAACAVLVAGIGVRVWLMQHATDDPSEAPFTITLTGGEQRGSGAVDVVIPRNVAQIRVQAEVDAAEGAACTLSVDEGDAAAFSASHLVVRSAGPYRFIEATVPANVLANGPHRLRVVAERAPGSSSSWLLTTRSP